MTIMQSTMSRAIRLEIIRARDGIDCFLCKKPFVADSDITFDHWMPRSKGGTWDVENLRLAHKKCNALKGDIVPNEDGTVTYPNRENSASRRALQKDQRAEVCIKCNSGRLLEYGETCLTCGSGPMPAKFPQWAQMRPKDCDHDMFHCWACVLGMYERKAAIHDVVNSSEVD